MRHQPTKSVEELAREELAAERSAEEQKAAVAAAKARIIAEEAATAEAAQAASPAGRVKTAAINIVRAAIYCGIGFVALTVAMTITMATGEIGNLLVLLSLLLVLVGPVVFAAMRSRKSPLYAPYAAVAVALSIGAGMLGSDGDEDVVASKPGLFIGPDTSEAAIFRLETDCEGLSVDCDGAAEAIRECVHSEAVAICERRTRGVHAEELAAAQAAEDKRIAATRAEAQKRLAKQRAVEAGRSYQAALRRRAETAVGGMCSALTGLDYSTCEDRIPRDADLTIAYNNGIKQIDACAGGREDALEGCTEAFIVRTMAAYAVISQ